MKKISILVPCYNVEKYIRQCLESIKTQTYTNIEVICIDDGSEDNTGAIIDEYVAEDSRFKVIHKANSGYGDSMNKGLEMCTGDYVGIVESDDWIEPNMYEVLLSTAERHDLDLVRCLWKEGPTGTENTPDTHWIKKDIVHCPKDKVDVFYLPPSIWAALYRRDLLEDGRKIRFLPTPGASFQDTSFAFKAYTKSKSCMLINKTLHHYRINPGSSVSSSGKVYCLIDEWEEMRRWIDEDAQLKEFISRRSLFPRIVYGGFVWNYNRLNMILRLWFLHRASQFFNICRKDGIFNLQEISSRECCGKELLQIMQDPIVYHYAKTYEKLECLFSGSSVEKNTECKDRVSIIVTCYNTSRYILPCLLSIIRQNYTNLEIICVDDCSTDETCTLVRHMMRRDNRIKLISTPVNSGPSVSRNLGLKHCHGKYVLFVDGDDLLLPGAINLMCSKMEESDDLVVGTISVDYEGGECLYGWLPQSDRRYYTNKKEKKIYAIDEIEKALGVHASSSAKLWRLDVIKRNAIEFPKGLLYEDANFYFKYLCLAPRIHIIKEPVYLYHRHLAGSTMSNTLTKKSGLAIQHLYIIDEAYHYLRERVSENIYRRILEAVYEPYFWLAYNNSPETDYDEVLSTMAKMLEEHNADTSGSCLLNYIRGFNKITKGQLFMQAFQGATHNSRGVRKILKHLKKLYKI